MIEKIEQLKILVIGDIMLDNYIVGDVERISPEAPVPIVKVTDEYSTLGGCGNVVRNLKEMGVNVTCCASISDDITGRIIEQYLQEAGVKSAIVTGSEKTTSKTRVIADQRKVQMLRIDHEVVKPVDHNLIIEELELYGHFDMTIVSDYAKGMITWNIMEYLRNFGENKIIIDPKPSNAYIYGRPLMLTPNKKEWVEMERIDQCDAEFILVTEGKDGMTLYDKRQGVGKCKIDANPVEVYNVSGAGDSVVSVMAICLALDIYPDKAARIANECAGYVVTQPGTTVVPKNKFIDSFRRYA